MAASRAAPQAPLAAQVYAALADGEFHSGEELAGILGVTRSAVWKATGTLRALGTPLSAVRNRGYQLGHASEPLEAERIRAQLARPVSERVTRLETAWSIESTNTTLSARPYPRAGTSEVLLAEFQTAGRGRRGRAWLAPPGGAVCLSLSWTFPAVSQDLGALGLVIGVCLVRALAGLGLAEVRLKWPNDLLLRDRKLGGVLIEMRAEAAGSACVVIGIGLNVAMGEALVRTISATGIQATDLTRAGITVARNALVAALVTACIEGLLEFERAGLKPFLEDWRRADALRGRPVNVTGGEGIARGLARGIDVHGALMVETHEGVQRFVSGDVTVRPE